MQIPKADSTLAASSTLVGYVHSCRSSLRYGWPSLEPIASGALCVLFTAPLAARDLLLHSSWFTVKLLLLSSAGSLRLITWGSRGHFAREITATEMGRHALKAAQYFALFLASSTMISGVLITTVALYTQFTIPVPITIRLLTVVLFLVTIAGTYWIHQPDKLLRRYHVYDLATIKEKSRWEKMKELADRALQYAKQHQHTIGQVMIGSLAVAGALAIRMHRK